MRRGQDPGVPWLSYEEVRRRANTFLAKYHPDLSAPVPIEEIVELKLHIAIEPLDGLGNRFEIEGNSMIAYLTSDMKAICVDDFVYRKRGGGEKL